MSTQAAGNGANPYYEGLHDAEDEQDMRNRLALVRERDALRAQLAASEARADRLREAGAALMLGYDAYKIRNGHIDDTAEMGALRAALAEWEPK